MSASRPLPGGLGFSGKAKERAMTGGLGPSGLMKHNGSALEQRTGLLLYEMVNSKNAVLCDQ